MAKTKEQKKEIVKNILEKFKQAKSVVFTSFGSLNVKENEELRDLLKKENSEYYAIKKTLLDLALQKNDFKDVKAKELDGRIAVVFGYEDEIAPAKTVYNFEKSHENKIELVGGILENKYIGPEEVKALAQLPGRTELYAKLVGSLASPMSGLLNAFSGNSRQLVYALNAIIDKKNS